MFAETRRRLAQQQEVELQKGLATTRPWLMVRDLKRAVEVSQLDQVSPLVRLRMTLEPASRKADETQGTLIFTVGHKESH